MLGNALIAFAGFVALCLAMEKHFSDLLGRKPSPRHLLLLRVAGWLLLSFGCLVRFSGRTGNHQLSLSR